MRITPRPGAVSAKPCGQVIILREYDGKSYADIAKRLGMQEPAVRRRFSRALHRLGKKMSQLRDEEAE